MYSDHNCRLDQFLVTSYQTFGAKLLVYTEEVNFYELVDLVVDTDGGWDSTDEADQLVALGSPHSTVPFFQPF